MVMAEVLMVPEDEWEHGDDLCDCDFPRHGDWSNPYTGRTQRVRICCLYAELEKLFPQFFQHIDAFYDENSKEYIAGTKDWNGEDDMPVHLWYRQLAKRTGMSLPEVRRAYAGQSPPKGNPRKQGRPVLSVSA